MFVLQHVSGKLRLLRLQFVTPFLFSVVVATACLVIKASPVENINAARFDHKLQTLTSRNTDSATTPNTVQLALYDRFAKTPGYSSAKNAKSDKGRSRRNAVSFKRDEAIRRDGDDNLDYFGWNSEMTNSAGLTDLRKYLNSDCIHFQNHKGRVRAVTSSGADSTVVKTIPCNHRMKYLDGQWEDTLYAEEPSFVVVRRETEPNPVDNESMDFIPIRGRKKESPSSLSSSTAEGWRHGMYLAQSSAQDIGPQMAVSVAPTRTARDDVVEKQSKRDSRQSSLRNTLWPVPLPITEIGRGKKGRIDKILAKEDFLPNRGKKLFLRWLENLKNPKKSPIYPKRGKKTRHFPKNLNSRPADLMWLTKDDFFPHRGKKLDNTQMDGDAYVDNINVMEDYYGGSDDVPEADIGNVSLDGVIFSGGGRDLISIGRQNRELLSNLSKQESRDKWRGRWRSVPTAREQYGDLRLRSKVPALNENNSEDETPEPEDDEHEDDQRPSL